MSSQCLQMNCGKYRDYCAFVLSGENNSALITEITNSQYCEISHVGISLWRICLLSLSCAQTSCWTRGACQSGGEQAARPPQHEHRCTTTEFLQETSWSLTAVLSSHSWGDPPGGVQLYICLQINFCFTVITTTFKVQTETLSCTGIYCERLKQSCFSSVQLLRNLLTRASLQWVGYSGVLT